MDKKVGSSKIVFNSISIADESGTWNEGAAIFFFWKSEKRTLDWKRKRREKTTNGEESKTELRRETEDLEFQTQKSRICENWSVCRFAFSLWLIYSFWHFQMQFCRVTSMFRFCSLFSRSFSSLPGLFYSLLLFVSFLVCLLVTASVKTLVVGPLQVNCAIIFDEASKKAVGFLSPFLFLGSLSTFFPLHLVSYRSWWWCWRNSQYAKRIEGNSCCDSPHPCVSKTW